MKVHLPNSAFIGNIDPFLRSLDTGADMTWLEITANKRWISVHPVVLAMVAALGVTVPQSNIQCEKFEATSSHYLERMNLFKLIKIRSNIKIKEHESAGRFIPLTQIGNSTELTKFLTEMVPLLHLEQKQAEPIRYIISELVRNVLEHAQTKHGAIVCAQYYKKSNTIRLGIADTGVGIKSTINQSYEAKTHLEAIKLALMPGITGTSKKQGVTEFNAGAGLFFIRSIAKVNRGFFMIYSGNALYKLLKSRKTERNRLYADPFKERHSKDENFPFWNGTAVGVDISLDATKQFSLLLDLIRKIYIQTIRERKKERHRKARFI